MMTVDRQPREREVPCQRGACQRPTMNLDAYCSDDCRRASHVRQAAAPLPAAPLLEFYDCPRSPARRATRNSSLERAIDRARSSGRLSFYVADQIAIRLLGCHPSLIWGDDWWTEA